MKINIRRSAVLAALVAALALPAAAGAQPLLFTTGEDGPLAVRNGEGFAVVAGRSAVLGQVGRGLLVVTAPSKSCVDLAVYGEDGRQSTDVRRVYTGRNIRFRVVSDGCRVGIAGRDLQISAVVRGFASVKGRGGRMAIDGDSWRRLPTAWETHRLGDPRPAVDRPNLRSLLRLEIQWMRASGMGWPAIKRTDVWRRFKALG